MCDVAGGIAREQCKNTQGGYKNLYLFNSQENPFTVVESVVTAINASLTTVYKFGLSLNGNSLVEDLVPDRASGTSLNTQTVIAMLTKITAEKSNVLNNVAKSYPMAVIEDYNGVYHAIGIDSGIDFTVQSTTGASQSGELYGYTLTGVASVSALSPKLDATTKDAFLALV